MQILCNSCQSSFRLDADLVKPTGSNVKCLKCQQIFKVLPPNSVNRRKHKRINTINLISHVTVDENGQQISQGLSKTIDISKGGILIEPYIKYPLGKLTNEQVKFGYCGLGLKYQFNNKHQTKSP